MNYARGLLYEVSKGIAEQNHLVIEQLKDFDQKATQFNKAIHNQVDLKHVKGALSNRQLLNPEVPLDKAILDAHQFLFSKLRTKQREV
jgi:hypothetical protein